MGEHHGLGMVVAERDVKVRDCASLFDLLAVWRGDIGFPRHLVVRGHYGNSSPIQKEG
jgi:hypothetical protein